MGNKNMQFVANTMTKALASEATRDHSVVDEDVYIDNVEFAALSREDAEEALNTFVERANAANVELGDIAHAATVVTHRGYVLDYANKTVRLKDEWVRKFCARLAFASKTGGTFIQWQSIAGMIIFAFQMFQEPPGKMAHLFKWLAALTRDRTPLSARVRIPDVAMRAVQQAALLIQKNEPYTPLVFNERNANLLFTDAARPSSTRASWGAVLVIPALGRILTVSGRFLAERMPDINQLEVEAVRLALNHFGWRIGKHLHIWTDNQVGRYVLFKQLSASPHLNERVCRVLERLKATRTAVRVSWLPSATNPADCLSRGIPIGDYEMTLLRQWIGVTPLLWEVASHRDATLLG